MFQFGGLQADSVVLYGGGTLMPWVKSIVMDGFATKKYLCVTLCRKQEEVLYMPEKNC